MMYLLAKAWSRDHTSLAMTFEQAVMSEEKFTLRSAGAGHLRSMSLSPAKAPV